MTEKITVKQIVDELDFTQETLEQTCKLNETTADELINKAQNVANATIQKKNIDEKHEEERFKLALKDAMLSCNTIGELVYLINAFGATVMTKALEQRMRTCNH